MVSIINLYAELPKGKSKRCLRSSAMLRLPPCDACSWVGVGQRQPADLCIFIFNILHIRYIYIYHIDMVEYTSGFIIHIIYIYHIDSLYICIYISYKSHTVYI